MRMIDRQTIDRIMDAANIVEVVSEFVTLRKAGSNYKGLCPFHNEKTPSFVVSPSRGTCRCFGCGKGGNSVGFIMEHEQMTYPEALRWLARKYHIEIKEREISDEEREQQNERESMFIVNNWAAGYFSEILHHHQDGMAVGLAYFRSRGIRDDIIKKFQLGFSLPSRSALAKAALAQGYKEEFLVKTGLCIKTEEGKLIDRFSNRAIFPWIGVSGKVVGFGGRVLDQRTKGVNQKYVNSPESEIYHKERELYGIFQAKKAIAKADCVYMVEGYTDVISMHQSGIENVVANSGTALSVHQVRMLHRFTQNIVLLYDGDEAGIHAAIRGTDMLLAEGMKIKVLLLPDGEDPDSFAKKHTAEEFQRYIEEHQTDFIQFKSNLLLGAQTDPLKRAEAINSIVGSIAQIQNPIIRSTYIQDCSQRFVIPESTLVNAMNRFILQDKEKREKQAVQEEQKAVQNAVVRQMMAPQHDDEVERMIIQLVIQHGEKIIFNDVENEDGSLCDLSVAQYIYLNLEQDGLQLKNELLRAILYEAAEKSNEEGFSCIDYFARHHRIEVSQLAIGLTAQLADLPELNKYDDRLPAESPLDEEEQRERAFQAEQWEKRQVEKLILQADHLLTDFRKVYVENKLKELKKQIKQAADEPERMMELMKEYQIFHQRRSEMAAKFGGSIIV